VPADIYFGVRETVQPSSPEPFFHQLAEVVQCFEPDGVAELFHGFEGACFNQIDGSFFDIEKYFPLIKDV
jgi:hypothetical protein